MPDSRQVAISSVTTMEFCSVMSTPERFGNCLSTLQLQELLILKKSVERMASEKNSDLNIADPQESCSRSSTTPEQPQRMALMAADRGDHHPPHSGSGMGGSWESDHHAPAWVEPKPSKLQTLFQISITALAFLSFGGYLLCLIVHAIKSKGTTYFHPVATAAATTTNGNVKRIKIYRRSKRQADARHRLLLQDYATYMRAVRDKPSWPM
ncbi:LOW QUALITY PROTEIN: uncharacterized protein LOC115626677, partial [Scaptodrosophila lebanonensis]|uniref:LOW QUALITY PROTEIN: uncharacterized protein LOC115626677 n=1 Tax=Drosophila lebanonensis TaxID=7225 RepID=A0A6J2TS61_DROLE